MKIDEITVFEDFLCLFVIMIHTVSVCITNYVKPGIISSLFYIFSRFLTFAVLAFLFSSGLKALYKYKNCVGQFNYAGFILDRVKKIYVPYVICVILYYLYFVFRLNYFPFEISELFRYIFYGNLSAHFYFIVVIMQFYLLMPLWHLICTKIPFSLSFFAALLITYITRLCLVDVFPGFMYFDRIFPYYSVFWVTGCYAGYNYDRFTEIISKYKSAVYLSALLVTSHVFLQYLNFCNIIVYKYREYVHVIFCLVFTVAFYLLVTDSIVLFKKLMPVLKKTSAITFYIYLIHVLVIFECNYLMDSLQIISTTQRFLIRTFFAYTISFTSSSIYVSAKKKIKIGVLYKL